MANDAGILIHKILPQQKQDQKYAVSVECWTQKYYCELVTNVVYDNFQDILVSGSYIQCCREYKKSLKRISYISTVHSCN